MTGAHAESLLGARRFHEWADGEARRECARGRGSDVGPVNERLGGSTDLLTASIGEHLDGPLVCE